jgi:hypothetical protein
MIASDQGVMARAEVLMFPRAANRAAKTASISTGYLRVPRNIMRSDVPADARFVYAVLMDKVREKWGNRVFPGVDAIAEECAFTKVRTERALRFLRSSGWIAAHRRGQGRTNEYTVYSAPQVEGAGVLADPLDPSPAPTGSVTGTDPDPSPAPISNARILTQIVEEGQLVTERNALINTEGVYTEPVPQDRAVELRSDSVRSGLAGARPASPGRESASPGPAAAVPPTGARSPGLTRVPSLAPLAPFGGTPPLRGSAAPTPHSAAPPPRPAGLASIAAGFAVAQEPGSGAPTPSDEPQEVRELRSILGLPGGIPVGDLEGSRRRLGKTLAEHPEIAAEALTRWMRRTKTPVPADPEEWNVPILVAYWSLLGRVVFDAKTLTPEKNQHGLALGHFKAALQRAPVSEVKRILENSVLNWTAVQDRYRLHRGGELPSTGHLMTCWDELREDARTGGTWTVSSRFAYMAEAPRSGDADSTFARWV